jgi:hypothetical protein
VAPDVRSDPVVAACAAAVSRALEGLPAGACAIESDVIAPPPRRVPRMRSQDMLGITVTPAREDAAPVFIVLSPDWVAVLAGRGDPRTRIELGTGIGAPAQAERLGAIVTAIAAGRIEDVLVTRRSGRAIRRTTEIELADGTRVRETSGRVPVGPGLRRERTSYHPY